MERILLVPSPHVAGREVEPYLPLGLFSLQAVAAGLGAEVDVLDVWTRTAGATPAGSGELAEAVLDPVDLAQYGAVGLSTVCSTFHHSVAIAKHIKAIDPRISVWMGGPHASVLSADILEACDAVDAVFVGEGEGSFAEVLARRSRGATDLTGIAGLQTRKSRYLPRPPLCDLDQLPFVELGRGFLAAWDTAKPYHFANAVPLDAARGCAGRCAFCSAPRFWGEEVRRKSDRRLIAEMRRIAEATGNAYFNLIGDNLATPRHRLLEFCRFMAESASDFRWVCNLKVDRITPPDLDTLWTGGCRGFFVGVESASQETLDRVGKGLVLAEELDVIRRAIDMGFLVETSLIVGFPWETKEDLDRTFDLHCEFLRWGAFRSSVSILCPLPGTQFAEDRLYRVSPGGCGSDLPRDSLPLDEATTELIRKWPRLFRHFGLVEPEHVGFADLVAVADAAALLNGGHAARWDRSVRSIRPPDSDASNAGSREPT